MLSIVTYGDPMLVKHSVVVPDINDEIRAFVEEMHETLDGARGYGLAAVQVGRLLRIFVTHAPRDGRRAYINPEILETSIEQEPLNEGCLSLPDLDTEVVRPTSVRVQAWNLKGKPFTLNASGMLARAIQHEYDHLNGILIIDKVNQKKKERLLAEYAEKART